MNCIWRSIIVLNKWARGLEEVVSNKFPNKVFYGRMASQFLVSQTLVIYKYRQINRLAGSSTSRFHVIKATR